MKSPLRIWGCVTVFLLTAHCVFAQQPVLKVGGAESPDVSLQKLDIDVVINGTMAVTTWTMTFKNNSSRILEGELTFPLGDGINVSRYALDINGKLRQAVPVEKAKGTVVFESIERRRVDPGLLEKVEGNSFRTRIYPFNAGASRTVQIGYEEELSFDDKSALKYKLPLGIKDRIESFDIKLKVLQSHLAPILEEDMDGALQIARTDEQYTISRHFNNYVPGKTLAISLPKQKNSTELLMQQKGNKYYYLVNSFMESSERKRALPSQLTILWDVSLSARNRNIEKELKLLEDYFSLVKNAQVYVVCFSNSIVSQDHFLVTDGNSERLRNVLRDKPFDGATYFGAIDFDKLPGSEVLLFSDGHNTYNSDRIRISKKTVQCIVSSAHADFSNLRYVSQKSGGNLINLNTYSNADALRTLQYQPLRFLGAKATDGLTAHYPSIPTVIGNSFSIAGVSARASGSITLQFGYGNVVTTEKRFELDHDRQAAVGIDIARVWAQKKIKELDARPEENMDEISMLGRQYGIVTRNTSLIVLETIQDYITYGIEPPEELSAQYAQMMKGRRNEIDQRKRTALEDATDYMEEILSWYKKDFRPKPAPKPYPSKAITSAPNTTPNQSTASSTGPIVNRAAGNLPQRTNSPQNVSALEGTVREKRTGETVIGAIVEVIQNGTVKGGAVTDVDGKYRITSLQQGGNYIVRARSQGLRESQTTNIRLSPGMATVLNLVMEESGSELSEVVVVDYVVPLIKKDEPGTTTTYTAQQIEAMPTRNTTDVASLTGGVYQAKTGTNSRGLNIAGGRTDGTVYIVDGVQVKGSAATNFPPQSIELGAETITERDDATVEADDDVDEVEELYEEEVADGVDYIALIRQTPRDKQYEKYLSLRARYKYRPTFFARVADYFCQTERKNMGLRILSNIAELGIEDYELYKMLGYKLRELNEYKPALYCFKKVLNWRPAEPQSYRDYGLALEDMGHFQRAFDTLYTALTLEFTAEQRSMYDGYQEVLLMEINQLAARHKGNINASILPKQLLKNMPVDVRVVLNWNMNDTDIDLWITDPTGENCSYNNMLTKMGGKLTDDFTQGFGPEQYQLKRAKKGTYTIRAKYFGDRVQKIAGPTTVLAEIYTRYGTPMQTRELVALQLDKDGDRNAYVAEFSFE